MVESANELEDVEDDEEEDSTRDDEGELDRLGEDGDEILEDDVELDECSTLMLELEEDSPKALLLLD